MRTTLITMFAIIASLSAFAAENTQKKCVFQDLQLGEIQDATDAFKRITKNDKMVGIPKIFSAYSKQLGTWDRKECRGTVQKTQYVSFSDHQVYTFYYTNEDRCDGGNSYGLILGSKEQSPNKDKVIATITDSFIDCL